MKKNESFQSGKSTRITKSSKLSLERTRAELLVWWKESFALVKRGSLNAIWVEAEVKEIWGKETVKESGVPCQGGETNVMRKLNS